jgi:hypothetical protein
LPGTGVFPRFLSLFPAAEGGTKDF